MKGDSLTHGRYERIKEGMSEAFDYKNLPEGWTPVSALERAVQGEDVSEGEKECAVLLLAAQLLMSRGMSYDDATAYIDSHNIGLNVTRVGDEMAFTISFMTPETEESTETTS